MGKAKDRVAITEGFDIYNECNSLKIGCGSLSGLVWHALQVRVQENCGALGQGRVVLWKFWGEGLCC